MPTKRHVGPIVCAVGSSAIFDEQAGERFTRIGASMRMALFTRHRRQARILTQPAELELHYKHGKGGRRPRKTKVGYRREGHRYSSAVGLADCEWLQGHKES